MVDISSATSNIDLLGILNMDTDPEPDNGDVVDLRVVALADFIRCGSPSLGSTNLSSSKPFLRTVNTLGDSWPSWGSLIGR